MSFNIFPANRARELVEASEKTLRGRLEEVSKKIEALAAKGERECYPVDYFGPSSIYAVASVSQTQAPTFTAQQLAVKVELEKAGYRVKITRYEYRDLTTIDPEPNQAPYSVKIGYKFGIFW